MARKNCTNIGGQAVLEGVMMRGKTAEAVAVRDPYGNIQVESKRLPEKKSVAYKIPVVRGVLSFINSLVGGSQLIMRSGEVYGEEVESEPTKADLWLQKHLKIDTIKIATYIGLVLGLALAVGLFIIVPTLIKNFVFGLIDMSPLGVWANFVENLALGLVRILIFICYLLAVSSMKEIKRLFAYHGAEHKTIACYEAGDELTPENVKKHSRLHDRCGTNFMFIVMIISILFFAIFFSLVEALSGWKPEKQIYEILIRLGALPLIAGLSYEALKLFAKFDNVFARIFKAPGRAMQYITTKEPDESMIEVAIVAFTTVLELEENAEKATSTFRTSVTVKKVLDDMKAINGEREYENEEILMCLGGYENRLALNRTKVIYKDIADKALEICRKRVESKEPLQYLLGKANFYGREFNVDSRVLIPRFDTEILVERALKEIGDKELRVLDMCTGSGAIAITVALNSKANVVASDISLSALEVARYNAQEKLASVEFVESDLFEKIEGKFDVIIINPPYIPSSDIESLDEEVKDYEPRLALDGGLDGMDIYRRIASEYRNYLFDNGVLMLEIGVNQREQIQELFGEVEFIKDYNNPPIDRVAIIRKGV